MEWKNLRARGYIGVESTLQRGHGIARGEKLLQKMVRGFVEQSALFYEKEKDFLFAYSENQIKPVLFANALDAEALPFAEYTVYRQKLPGSGRLDLGIIYGETVFMVEVKHITLTRNWRSDTQLKQPWAEAKEQLRGVKPASIKELSRGGRRTVCRIAMLVAPVYQMSLHKKRLKTSSRSDIQLLVDKATDAFEPKPNWIAAWEIPESWQKPFEVDWRKNTYHQNWQTLLFFCRLEEVPV